MVNDFWSCSHAVSIQEVSMEQGHLQRTGCGWKVPAVPLLLMGGGEISEPGVPDTLIPSPQRLLFSLIAHFARACRAVSGGTAEA